MRNEGTRDMRREGWGGDIGSGSWIEGLGG